MRTPLPGCLPGIRDDDGWSLGRQVRAHRVWMQAWHEPGGESRIFWSVLLQGGDEQQQQKRSSSSSSSSSHCKVGGAR